jgi:hypothetical protein
MSRIVKTAWRDNETVTPGIRIERGKHYLLIPDAEILPLAMNLADYLESSKNND